MTALRFRSGPRPGTSVQRFSGRITAPAAMRHALWAFIVPGTVAFRRGNGPSTTGLGRGAGGDGFGSGPGTINPGAERAVS